MSFKLTIIGAGSLTFARTLFSDIMHVPELRNIEVAFTDINQKNLDMVTQLCQRDLEANGIKTKIFSTTDRREALRDARYIVNCVRIGGLEAFETDIDIPLKYGVDQCVGDTLCIGGIMYGQRGIAALLDFCKDIREVAEPNALLLNYSNPMAMLTWACLKYGGVRTIGLCHGEIHGEMQIADVLGAKDRKELDVICAGLNHQTWYLSVKKDGVEMKDRLLEGFEKHPEYSKTEKVRIDVLRRFGYYSTESNGHLSEYVSWYRKRPDEIEKWIDLTSWINGETGGYLRVCRENRNWFETEFPKLLEEPPKDYDHDERSSEHGSYIIEALETGRVYRGHFNVMNQGTITNLPDDCVVEVPCYVDGNGISVPKVGPLPMGCAAVLIKCGTSGMYYKTAGTERIASIGTNLKFDPEIWVNQEGKQPCFEAEIVRSGTGAGDLSIAAFLSGVLRGYSPQKCTELAAAEGAASVSSYDALGGLLQLDELNRRIAAGWKVKE